MVCQICESVVVDLDLGGNHAAVTLCPRVLLVVDLGPGGNDAAGLWISAGMEPP